MNTSDLQIELQIEQEKTQQRQLEFDLYQLKQHQLGQEKNKLFWDRLKDAFVEGFLVLARGNSIAIIGFIIIFIWVLAYVNDPNFIMTRLESGAQVILMLTGALVTLFGGVWAKNYSKGKLEIKREEIRYQTMSPPKHPENYPEPPRHISED